MTAARAVRIGYARCSAEKQDLTAQHRALLELDVDEDALGAFCASWRH